MFFGCKIFRAVLKRQDEHIIVLKIQQSYIFDNILENPLRKLVDKKLEISTMNEVVTQYASS